MTQIATRQPDLRIGNALVVEDWDNLRFQVHRSAYRSPEVFRQEMAQIFSKNWLYLGHVTELPHPGDFKARRIAGRPVIFCRDDDGRIRCFLDSCPHRGTILCRERDGNAKHFQCFYHAWTFRNTGELASLPDDAAYPSEFRDTVRLREVPRLDIHEGFVFISFEPDVPPLLEHLGDAADYITMSAQIGPQGMEVLPGVQQYGARGNWKLTVENAMDGYHFAPTHNTFIGFLRDSGFHVNDEDQYAYDLGNGHGLLVLTGHNGRVGMMWEPRFGEQERLRTEAKRAEMGQRLGAERAAQVADASRILYVFPNLLLLDIEVLSIRQLEPIAPGRTDFRAWQFVEVGEPEDARSLRTRTMVTFLGPGGLASPDDIEAYEAVQRGMAATEASSDPDFDWSDMSRGMADEVAGNQGRSIDEGAMRSFWRHWSRCMGEIDGLEPPALSHGV